MRGVSWLGLCAVCALASHARVEAQPGGGDLDRNCLNAIGNVRIGGSLLIAGRCELDGTDVRGNVTLFAGGSLIARNARIHGNLSGSRANFVDIERSRIDGTVVLEELVGDVSSFEQNDLRRDVELRSNRSKLELLNNDIRRELRILNNTGGVLISGNAIDRDLRCTGNTPAPVGIGNRVDGAATGQCQNLQPETPPAPPPPEPTPSPTPTPAPTPSPTPEPTPTPTPTPTPEPTPTPAPSPPPGTQFVDEGGGAGAFGWPALLLLALLARPRGASRRRETSRQLDA